MMIRKLLNAVIETTLQVQPNSLTYPNPFTRPETVPLGWLSSVAPCFPVNARNVTVLSEPGDFYEVLLEGSRTATERITLASLYLGNGDLEKRLVDAILNNARFKELKVNVLLDFSRGSRPPNSSRQMVLPLIRNATGNCNVSFYHTPVLRGVYKRLIPNRWNELVGTQHMKLYIFDDTLVISGANLSNDYFTNRQDRYFVIRDRRLCDFYCGLVGRVQSFSLRIDEHDRVLLNEGWSQLPYEGSKHVFVQKAGDLVESFLYDCKDEQNIHRNEGYDTWIFPLVQMGQLGIEQETRVTDKILSEAPEGSRMKIATAYFNLTQNYINTLIRYSKAHCELLLAHPTANGFLGAKGMAGGIPDGYTLIAQRFRNQLARVGQEHRFRLHEYIRQGWTFHAKGLWYYSPGCDHPSLTLVGSSNFSDRSVLKDVESQVAIVTENPALQETLHSECSRLFELGPPGDLGRPVPVWVYAMVFLFRDFF